MRAEAQVPAKCPYCGRLTVDNNQHCPNLKPTSKWLASCATVVCKCGATYRQGGQFRLERRVE